MSIKSKSNRVRVVKETPVCDPNRNPRTYVLLSKRPTLPPTTSPGQRIEQMRQLAIIFASIFEALEDEHEHAIATTREAA